MTWLLIILTSILFIVANLIMNPPQAWCDWIFNLATKNKDTKDEEKE